MSFFRNSSYLSLAESNNERDENESFLDSEPSSSSAPTPQSKPTEAAVQAAMFDPNETSLLNWDDDVSSSKPTSPTEQEQQQPTKKT
jgi:hypothetical protein